MRRPTRLATKNHSLSPLTPRDHTLTATLPPPKKLRVTHWSSRSLAGHLKTDASTLLRIWRHYRVQPWRSETFTFSPDPELVAKVAPVVGFYLCDQDATGSAPDLRGELLASDPSASTLVDPDESTAM